MNHIGLWKSKNTGITYPSGWHITMPKFEIELDVTPCVKEQEVNSRLTTPTSYWEGACEAEGTKKGKNINGKSYVELVGYDNRIMSKLLRSSIV
ncbi:lipocalin family protein [Patescibacteria group bacterium]